jgi:hypothetical protein
MESNLFNYLYAFGGGGRGRGRGEVEEGGREKGRGKKRQYYNFRLPFSIILMKLASLQAITMTAMNGHTKWSKFYLCHCVCTSILKKLFQTVNCKNIENDELLFSCLLDFSFKMPAGF